MKFRGIVCLLLLFLSLKGDVYSQSGTSTSGTDFWLGFMRNNAESSTDLLRVDISSSTPASGVIEIADGGWSQNFYVNPGDVTSVVVPSELGEMISSQQSEMKGIHITTDVEVWVTAISYESSTTDAARILPVTALGTNYVIASYAGNAGHESELLVVATQDNTIIRVTPSSSTDAGDVAGMPFIVDLNAGECYQIFASENGDLTGTQISASAESGSCRPFAVFSGAGCANVPSGCASACDHLWEQNSPIENWGTEFFVTPPVFSTDPDYGIVNPRYTYRILSANDGTGVTIDGVASFILNAGEFQEYNDQESAHCIIADQPVTVIQYLQGISCGGNGDPSMYIVDDVSKQTTTSTFITPSTGSLGLHYLNFVIDAGSLGTVSLDGSPISAGLFHSFSFCSGQLWCGMEVDEGIHHLEVPGGFTGTLYGISESQTGVSESYATSLSASFVTEPMPIEDSFCSLNSITLTLAPGYESPQWFNLSDPENILSEEVSLVINAPITNGLYMANVVQSISGCQEKFYYSVESPAPINLVMTPDDMTICDHQGIPLHVLTGQAEHLYQFEWTPQTGLDFPYSSSPVATPDATTTYNVQVTTLSGCSVANASITLTVNEGNVAEFHVIEEEVGVCENQTAALGVISETVVWRDNFDPSISWGDWQSIDGGSEDDICGSVTGTSLYFNGTYPREAVTESMDLSAGGHIYFSLKIASGSAPCDNAEPGDNVVLSYSVDNGAWVNIQTCYEASYPEFTEVVIEIPVGAMTPNTRLRWRQVGSYTNNQDNWSLDNMYVGVNDLLSYSCQWTPALNLNDATSFSPIVTPEEDVVYHVSMTDASSGCVYIDSVRVEVGSPFDLVITGDTAICDEQGVILQAIPSVDGVYSYLWDPGSTMQGEFGSSPTVTPQSTTTYHVTVTSSQGCTSEGDVEVVVSALLDLEITANDEMICSGENVELAAVLTGNPVGLSYQWLGDTTLNTPNSVNTQATPVSDTEYICTVTHDESGCQVTEHLMIDVTESFDVTVSSNEVISCIVEGTTITAATSVPLDVDWNWSPSSHVNDSNSNATTVSVNESVVLMVTATTESGCTSSAEVIVEVQELALELGDDIGICEDGSITLDSGWPADYDILWSTLESTPSITVDQAGAYSVTVISPDGCMAEDEIEVSVYHYPEVELGPDTSLCDGMTLLLNAGNTGMNYHWNNGAETQQIEALATGIYVVTVDNGYCFSTDEVGVQYHQLPERPFSERLEYCFGIDPDGFYLDAENEGSTYLWDNDSTFRALQVKEAGEYSVMITTEHYCSSTYSIFIEEECPVSLYVPNSFTPDGDGLNDQWEIKGENIAKFHLMIYNRLGEQFYESFDMSQPWLGQRHDGDYYVQPGVYDYRIVFQTVDEDGILSEEKSVNGFVTLLR